MHTASSQGIPHDVTGIHYILDDMVVAATPPRTSYDFGKPIEIIPERGGSRQIIFGCQLLLIVIVHLATDELL